MNHPVGRGRLCALAMVRLPSECVIHAGHLTMITLQSSADPLLLATPMAVK